jgi:hypothetical protein
MSTGTQPQTLYVVESLAKRDSDSLSMVCRPDRASITAMHVPATRSVL